MAADELYYCLFTGDAAVDGTGQAAAILWELYITDYPPVLSAIVNTYCTGSPSDDPDLVADLETALRLQRELLEALDCLWLEGEEPEKGICWDCEVSFDVHPERDPIRCYHCHEFQLRCNGF